MSKRELGNFFCRMTACVLIPLVAASAYLLREVIKMVNNPSYPLDGFVCVPDIIGTILSCIILYLAAYFVMIFFLHRKMNFKGNNRKK